MATIKQILEIENTNNSHIHLFKEGLFLKAYQRSAYLFNTTVKPFKTIPKYFKGVQQHLVLLGFPSGGLDNLFPQANVKQVEEGYYVVSLNPETVAFDVEKYNEWFLLVEQQYAKEQERMKEKEREKEKEATLFSQPNPVPVVENEMSESSVRDKIMRFPLEQSTPIECMLFLSELRRSLRD